CITAGDIEEDLALLPAEGLGVPPGPPDQRIAGAVRMFALAADPRRCHRARLMLEQLDQDLVVGGTAGQGDLLGLTDGRTEKADMPTLARRAFDHTAVQ